MVRVHGNLFVDGAYTDTQQFAHFRYSPASGTNGGTLTAGTWTTRLLGTSVTNDIPSAALVGFGGNLILLPAGTYYIEAIAPGYLVGLHRARIFDFNNNVTLLHGQNAESVTTGNTTTPAEVRGIITSTSTRIISLSHYITTSTAATDAGRPTSIAGVNEVYGEVFIWKIN